MNGNLSLGLNDHNRDVGQSPSRSSVQIEAGVGSPQTLCSYAAKIQTDISELPPGPGCGQCYASSMLERLLSTADLGCGLSRGII